MFGRGVCVRARARACVQVENNVPSKYLLTYLLIYLLTFSYLLTYLLTYLLVLTPAGGEQSADAVPPVQSACPPLGYARPVWEAREDLTRRVAPAALLAAPVALGSYLLAYWLTDGLTCLFAFFLAFLLASFLPFYLLTYFHLLSFAHSHLLQRSIGVRSPAA